MSGASDILFNLSFCRIPDKLLYPKMAAMRMAADKPNGGSAGTAVAAVTAKVAMTVWFAVTLLML
jgi:hypothetical protein